MTPLGTRRGIVAGQGRPSSDFEVRWVLNNSVNCLIPRVWFVAKHCDVILAIMRFAVLAVLAVSGLAGGEKSTDMKAFFKRLTKLDISANFLKERHFAIRHSFEGALIDLAHIRCALRDPTFLAATAAAPPRAVTFFKLEKTGGTSVASSIVSSCVARMCADGRTPCDVSASGLDVACAGDMITCKGLVENEDRERTPLWRAIKACAKLPLLVNKGTVDAYERHGKLCYVSPSPHACVVTPYRDFLIVFREPRAPRLLCVLFEFWGSFWGSFWVFFFFLRTIHRMAGPNRVFVKIR